MRRIVVDDTVEFQPPRRQRPKWQRRIIHELVCVYRSLSENGEQWLELQGRRELVTVVVQRYGDYLVVRSKDQRLVVDIRIGQRVAN